MAKSGKKFDWTLVIVILLMVAGLGGAVFLNLSSEGNSVTVSSKMDIDNGDVNINWNKYPSINLELSESVTITTSGVYNLYGNISDGQIVVDAGDDSGKVKLIMNGNSISCSDGPAIYVKSGDDVVIEVTDGTSNSLSDGTSYGESYDENVNGAVYSMSDLAFTGAGELKITGNYQDGIVSKDDLTFRSGDISVNAVDDAIRGKDSVHVVAANLEVTSGQDGIKSTNEDDESKGFVYLEGGEITINAGDDGIHATTYLLIDDGKIDVQKSYEGLEGSNVTINGGEIDIVSSDDGINVAGGTDESGFSRPGAQSFSNSTEHVLTINDGDIYVNATGDGLDSNGALYINGGNVVVDGPVNSANGALDSGEMYEVTLNGGSLIAVGASGMAEVPGDASLLYSVSIYFENTIAAGTEVKIKNSSGTTVIQHTGIKTYDHMVAGGEMLKLNETYTIYVGGEEYETFTVTEKTTTVGEAAGNAGGSFQGMQGGGMSMPSGESGDFDPTEMNGEGGDFDPTEMNGEAPELPDGMTEDEMKEQMQNNQGAAPSMPSENGGGNKESFK